MGERGITPLPTALKLVARAKKNRINQDEPQPEEGIPECPSSDPAVLDVWNYTIRQLKVMKTITMADRDLLHAYCEQVVMHRRAVQLMGYEGAFHNGIRHPAWQTAKEAAQMMKMLGSLFGLSPSARTAIKVADQKPSVQVGAARLLSG